MDITEAMDENLIGLPNLMLAFREWIFPNSLKFPCSGLLTGWIFRASNITITPENNLPLWVVYYRTTGTDQLSFTLREGSRNITGVTKVADGVYQYSLQSPVQVEEGDVVGIQYQEFPSNSSNSLQLSFVDDGGADGPVSYWRQASDFLFLVGNSSENLSSFVRVNTQYTPLVTTVMSKYLNRV